MKKRIIALLLAPLCGAFLCQPSYAQKTKAQLNTEVSTTFPDNIVGAITPAGVRIFQSDVINSIMPTAPVVSGNLACFNGTTGLLQDCGVAPNSLTVGVTNVANGSSGNVLFNNAGKLGEYTISGTGGVAMTNSPAFVTPNIGAATASGLTSAGQISASTSTAGLGSGFFATGSGASVAWNRTDLGADLKNWDITVNNSGSLIGRTISDAGAVGTAWITVARSGTSVSSVSIPALTYAANSVGNAALAQSAANTLKGNPTGATANQQDFTIGGLTQKATPAGTDLLVIQDQAASGALKYATVSSAVASSISAANPAASVGLSAVNGSASTYMRSDGAPALSQAIVPTWTGTHTFNNGTYSALFTNPAGFNGQTTPAAPIHVGTAALQSTAAGILLARANTGATNVHAFAENSTYNLGAAALGVADFDALATFTGAQTYDHHISFQSRPIYGSSGTITNFYGFGDFSQINAGTATNHYQHYASNPVGAGTITNAYGFYSEALTKGSTLNYAFFSAGTTPSKFGGNVDAASFSVAGTDATGAWTAYTPTFSTSSGAITTATASGRYKQIGKTVCFSAQLVITTNGTGAGHILMSLPVAPRSGVSNSFPGTMSGNLALTVISDTGSNVDLFKYDGTYSGGAVGNYFSGCYEAA